MSANKGQSPDFCREIGKLGGRPKGRKSRQQMIKEAVMEEYRQNIMRVANVLFEKQLHLAVGQTFLFRIDKIRVGKNRYINSEPKLVTDPHEMRAYLEQRARGGDGDMDDPSDPSASYYFLTAKEPNNQAIDSMRDFAFGKPRQVVGLEGSKPGSAIEVLHLNDDQYERIIRDEAARIAADPAYAGSPTADTPAHGGAEADADSAPSSA